MFNFRFIRLVDNRIGHLVMNTEVFLRRREYNTDKKRYLGIASDKPCNERYLCLIKGRLHVLQIKKSVYDNLLFRALSSDKCILGMLKLFYELPYDYNEYIEFNLKKTLSFTPEEEEEGKRLLKKLGINSWYVCVHNRDKAYLGENDGQSFRNCSIKNYMKAMEYITKKGGYVIRIGAKVEDALNTANPKIIDYATKYRTDFGDVYLSSHCKFFLGNTSGLQCIAVCFDVPVIYANQIPPQIPYHMYDSFLQKKIYSNKEQRYLTIKEMFELGNLKVDNDFISRNLVPVENTEDEIYTVTKKKIEMPILLREEMAEEYLKNERFK